MEAIWGYRKKLKIVSQKLSHLLALHSKARLRFLSSLPVLKFYADASVV